MVRKAKLDILDIPSEEDAAGNRKDNPPDEGTSLHSMTSRITGWIFTNKILALSIVGGLLFLMFIAGLWMALSGKRAVEKPGGAIALPETSSAPYSGTRLDGFVVDVKDDGGNLRVLICDLVLEPVPGQAVKDLEFRIDIRQTVYRILRAREVRQLMVPEGRSVLKKEIQAEMVRLLGDGKVKDVYFTRYMIL